MRPTLGEDGYEYVATYVDNLLLAMKDPQGFIKILESKPYCLKFKGTSKIDFHLGADFSRDPSGTLYISPRRYIERIEETYEKFFGEKPKRNVSSPLEDNDHPKLDTSEFMDDEGRAEYQTLIGQMQWAVLI